MNFADIIALALRNLRQAKLRTALTVIGVIVGVAAIITMVSFGFGLQQNIVKQAFARLDAFTAITVLGADAEDLLTLSEGRTVFDREENEEQPSPSPSEPAPTGTRFRPQRVLNDETVAEIKKLDGVSFVMPLVRFSCFTRFNERTRMQTIGGALAGADPRFKTFLAGRGLTDENANEAVVTERFLAAFTPEAFRQRRTQRGSGPFQRAETRSDEERAKEAQAALGQEITIFSQPDADAAPESIFGIPLFNAPSDEEMPPNSDSRFERRVYRIVGVLKADSGINFSPFGNLSFYVPLEQAKGLRKANLPSFERMGEALAGQAGYRALELRVADPSRIKSLSEQLGKMGLRAVSVVSQLEEIERIFLIVNSSLALIGGIALLVAAFGISNTMIMSIRERTREIGIMKAIGGADGEIMRIFFVEASLIGLLGGALGVAAGWAIDRIANVLANQWITQRAGVAMRYVDFFVIPWYLAAGAILFAVLISVVAAIYPARQAAKVDPIKALRHE